MFSILKNDCSCFVLYSFQKPEDQDDLKSALKALAACTQINDHARIFVVDHKGRN